MPRERTIASMEPLPKERSDEDDEGNLFVSRRASMEPLPKERSDDGDRFSSLPSLSRPQWSRSRRSGATDKQRQADDLEHVASMEPLPKERSDARTR